MDQIRDIAIIGGGASGLMAAVTASRLGVNVTVLEGEERVGRKLLVTGSGRCNLTNSNCDRQYYHGSGAEAAYTLIKKYDSEETLKDFEAMGLLVKTEEKGRVYPFSDTASSVLDILRLECERLNIEIITGFKASALEYKGGVLNVTSKANDIIKAYRVIIATGGLAGTKFGCDGSGYKLLKKHKITDLYPSLVQLISKNETVKSLSGLKTDVLITAGDKTSHGELLFTDYGLSGPAVFDISRDCSIECIKNGGIIVHLDLMPDISKQELTSVLLKRITSYPDRDMEKFFIGMFHRRIGMAVVKIAGIKSFSALCRDLTTAQIDSMVNAIKDWQIFINSVMQWQNAQVTAGGITMDDFNPDTLESNLMHGVYACGEIFDVDGDCGGFNLQWAWTSGHIAAQSAAKSIIKEK